MKSFLYYLVQLIACSGILYGYYHFALRNKKFHQYNRYFLLLIPLISIIVQLVNIPVVFDLEHAQPSLIVETLTAISPDNINTTAPITESTDDHRTPFTVANFCWLAYLLIALFIFIRFIHGLLRISRLLKKYVVERIGGIYFINTQEPETPFSFFKWLFWNKKIDLRSEYGDQIFKHELFHIQQKHSWDVTFLEATSIVFWINPFFLLVKKELKAIHEFLADEFATREKDKWEYVELLLMQVLNSSRNLLVNPFFHNQIKRRIAMITSSQRDRFHYLRKIMVLPVAIVAIALFAFRYRTIIQNQNGLADKVNTINTPKTISDDATYPARHDTSKPTRIKIDRGDTSLPSNLVIIIDGQEQKQGMTIKELDQKVKVDDIQEINILKDGAAVAKYGDKAKNGVIEILTKKNKDLNIETIKSNIQVDNRIGSEIFDSTVENERINDHIEKREMNDQVNNIIFEKVEIDPSFPGGETAWRNFLATHLKESVPTEKGAPAGDYTVWLRFVVDNQGNISNIKPLTNYGYGMEEESMRIIKLSPKWNPARQNGHVVTAYKKQPITFRVENKTRAAVRSEYPVPASGDYNDPGFKEKWRR